MGDLDRLLSDAADYVGKLLEQCHAARDELLRLRYAGQEPNVLRVIMPETCLLIRFQDVPE